MITWHELIINFAEIFSMLGVGCLLLGTFYFVGTLPTRIFNYLERKEQLKKDFLRKLES
jgi:hypothetical protein